MLRILRAELARLWKSAMFYLALTAMLALAAMLMVVQATGMDYTVSLSRVIFLPMSMYGIVMAVFISAFVGADFSDGFIRNKLLLARRRGDLVISEIIVSCVAAVAVYAVATAFSAGAGRFFFDNDVEGVTLLRYFALGFAMSAATGCLFAVVTMLCGNRTRAVIWCAGLAFGMLLLCLHTNEILIQEEYRDGVLNPHYIGGLRREIYSLLHDINPCGQAAQLSAWKVWHPFRLLMVNALTVIVASAMGCILFQEKNVG